ncbi:MAG: NADP-dependent oxidoreductase [Solirubrobacterales bacterium]|nr:NADP-dependent oxidoreductase [Solirubrobacterales bacterium]
MTRTNQQFRLASRPTGLPTRETWELTEEPVPDPAEGEIVVEVLYTSLDPAMRAWLNEGESYVPPVAVGEVMRALGVGRVIAARHQRVAEGDHVSGLFGIQRYAVVAGDTVQPVDPEVAPLPAYLNALGIPGMTAYFGLLEIGQPQEGQTVVVSAAAGAVGSLAGQIAKIKGCRAIGIAGGPEKCRIVTEEYGFDAAIDYRSANVRRELRERCPGGIDVYFDNVGGDVLEAALSNLARGARVVLCGAISQYNEGAMRGPRNYMALLIKRARMEGFVVFDFARRYDEAGKEIARWLGEGRLRSREHVVDGIETFPESLLMLYNGENMGKLVLRVGT